MTQTFEIIKHKPLASERNNALQISHWHGLACEMMMVIVMFCDILRAKFPSSSWLCLLALKYVYGYIFIYLLPI